VNVTKNVPDKIAALVVGAVAAGCTAITAFVSVLVVAALFFSGEAEYGVALYFGPPVALVAGAFAFVVAYRRTRSLERTG
jgi:hypothetical protein